MSPIKSKSIVFFCQRTAGRALFQNFILGVIVANAIVIGVETSPILMDRWGGFFHALNLIFQGIFLVEISIRLTAHAPRFQTFFRNGWNVFDFTVVLLSMVPAIGSWTTLARVARLLRVTRLIAFSAELRLIISTMLRSIPSIGHIAMLMGLLIYVYAVTGVHLFGRIDPEKWGHLGRAALTLFEVITLEGWIEFQGRVIEQVPMAWLFFSSFIVVAVFVMVNLLVAVVINNLETVKAETPLTGEHEALRQHIRALRKNLDDLESRLPKP